MFRPELETPCAIPENNAPPGVCLEFGILPQSFAQNAQHTKAPNTKKQSTSIGNESVELGVSFLDAGVAIP